MGQIEPIQAWESHMGYKSLLVHLDLGRSNESLLQFAGELAEVASVLPDRHRLGAECDAVDRRVIAVLTRNRDRTGQTLRGERRQLP